jgi:hypothetical protein
METTYSNNKAQGLTVESLEKAIALIEECTKIKPMPIHVPIQKEIFAIILPPDRLIGFYFSGVS